MEKVPLSPADAGAAGPVVEVQQSTQAQVGDLRIGLGYVRKAQYTDASGATRRGLVAGLWIFFRGDTSKDKTVDAYPGQRILVGSYALYVEEIRGGRTGLVRLRVRS